MFFPEEYIKPVMQNIVDASENGWNAICDTGNGAASTGRICNTGTGAGAGTGTSNLLLYSNPDSTRLFNTDDVGSGV